MIYKLISSIEEESFVSQLNELDNVGWMMIGQLAVTSQSDGSTLFSVLVCRDEEQGK